jgi:tRNA(fMet)-specific endonuclease VapC
MARLRFLLDANVISELYKPEPNRRLLSKFESHRYAITMAAPTLHELRFGLLRLPEGARRAAGVALLNSLLASGCDTTAYDHNAAEWHARERARLARRGINVPYVDAQIAAVAATHEMILVTRNTSDFRHYVGLRIENWYR